MFLHNEYWLSLEEIGDTPVVFCIRRMIERAQAQQRAEEIKNMYAIAEWEAKNKRP